MKKANIFAICCVLIWATMATIVKSMLTGIPNLEALSVSSFFAFLFLLLVNVCGKRMDAFLALPPGRILGMAVRGFLGLFLYSALYYESLNVLSAQEACIINYLWPMMLVLFSVILLKEPMSPEKAAGLFCSFLGIVVLSLGGGASAANDHRMRGILFCVLGAACYGLYCVLNKKAKEDENLTMMVIWFTVTVCAGVLGRLTEDWVPIRGIMWLGILWLGIVIDGAAYLLWALAMDETDNTASVANLAYLTPFLSLVFSAAFLKEAITLRAVLALLLIVGGILIQNAAKKQ